MIFLIYTACIFFIVKSAAHAGMASKKLEDLILNSYSSDHTVHDTLNIPVIIDKLSAVPRALPLWYTVIVYTALHIILN